MPTIKFIDSDGRETLLDAEAGTTVMKTAVDNGLRGIEADCGGACACATCHVYIAETWVEAIGPAGDDEAEMLSYAVEPRPNSRLSCQIKLTEALDGLVVHTPVSQH